MPESDLPPVCTQALRVALERVAAAGETRSYREVAMTLGLEPPQTIHRLTVALEQLMEEDVEAARPLLAAVVISRTRAGLPAPGFFTRARELGRHDGPDSPDSAAAFHKGELAAVYALYGDS